MFFTKYYNTDVLSINIVANKHKKFNYRRR